MGDFPVYVVAALGPVLRPLSTGTMFPDVAEVLVYISDEKVITLYLRVADGHPYLHSMAIAPNGELGPSAEIAPSDVHGLALKKLTDDAIRYVAMSIDGAAPRPYGVGPVRAATGALQARVRRTLDDDLLSEVARIYMAKENRHAPTKAVQEQLYCSHRTAGRWVQMAREKGLLPVVKTGVPKENKKRRQR